MKQSLAAFLLFVMAIAALFPSCVKKENMPNIIPKPLQLELKQGNFVVPEQMCFFIDCVGNDQIWLEKALAQFPFPVQKSESQPDSQLKLLIDNNKTGDGYELTVNRNGIEIRSACGAGLFYGVQTLLQYVQIGSNGKINIPCLNIKDAPRYAYRGLHLDVSRHFFDVDFIKKQLDIMAHYKLNRFHWHLTDGAGWRIEIKKYPRLTEFAAWRQGKWKEWWKSDRHYCLPDAEGVYGGFYTQEQIKDVVAYAAERYITIIPEIEMPGHSDEVLAAYPQLSCKGKPYTSGDFCVGNDETYIFLQNVLTEVIDLFPSKFIHIGGDEAGKEAWKTCPKCQKLMQDENLSNVNQLQSCFVRRIERFLHNNGREIIGWNEILEGGVSSEAVIMSWTGEEPGIRAARQGNRVVMTPAKYCYFDMYQANPAMQPEAIGGYVDLEKVYSYEPTPIDSLTEEQQRMIIGVQANVWTEYMPTPEHVEYMIYPRLLALSEVAWTQPDKKSWTDFLQRVNKQIPQLRASGINAFELSDEPMIEQEMLLDERKVRLTMSSERVSVDIRYTTDGTEPNSTSLLYEEPITFDGAVMLTAALFKGKQKIGPSIQKYYGFHKALGKQVTYNNAGYGNVYSAGGDTALVDGITGSFSYTDKHWQGFSLNNMDVTIDLEEKTPIKTISATFMQLSGPWIWLPKEVEIYISDDNEHFTQLIKIENTIPTTQEGLILKNFGYEGSVSARYIRYKAQTCGIEHGWMFVDEIVVM